MQVNCLMPEAHINWHFYHPSPFSVIIYKFKKNREEKYLPKVLRILPQQLHLVPLAELKCSVTSLGQVPYSLDSAREEQRV